MKTGTIENQTVKRLVGVSSSQDGNTHFVQQGNALVGVSVIVRFSEPSSKINEISHHDQCQDSNLAIVQHLLGRFLVEGPCLEKVSDELSVDVTGYFMRTVVWCVTDEQLVLVFAPLLDDLLVLLLW